MAISGAAVRWLRDNLGIIKEAKDVGKLPRNRSKQQLPTLPDSAEGSLKTNQYML